MNKIVLRISVVIDDWTAKLAIIPSIMYFTLRNLEEAQ